MKNKDILCRKDLKPSTDHPGPGPSAMLEDAPARALARAQASAATLAFLGSAPPSAPPLDAADAVCVLQDEAALLPPRGGALLGGSDAATTCCIALAWAPGRGALVAHVGSARGAAAFAERLAAFAAAAGGVDVTLSLVGSFDTAGHNDSRVNLEALLGAVHALRGVRVRLGVAAVGEANTLREPEAAASGGDSGAAASGSGNGGAVPAFPRPRFTAAVIDAASGNVRPAAFASALLRPFALERGACMWQSDPPELPLVYDGSAGVSPPRLSSSWAISAADCAFFLSLDDADFLEKLSTSPEVEGAEFVRFLRAVLRFVLEKVSALEATSSKDHGS